MSRLLAIGRTLAEAERLLAGAGVELLGVEVTRPPGDAPTGPLRVIRERWEEGGIRLLVAPSVALREERGPAC